MHSADPRPHLSYRLGSVRSAASLSINHLSCRCHLAPRRDFSLGPFRAQRHFLCRLPPSAEKRSAERMKLCIDSRLEFFWPGTLFSLASAPNVCSNGLFFMSINGALFMCPPGKAFFLRGFRRIWHYTQSGPLRYYIFFSCRGPTRSITLRRTRFDGRVPCERAVTVRMSSSRPRRTAGAPMRAVSQLLPVSER